MQNDPNNKIWTDTNSVTKKLFIDNKYIACLVFSVINFIYKGIQV